MRKIAYSLLLLPLAACSGSANEQSALAACETAVGALMDGSGTIEKLTIQNENVHALVAGKNGRGETVFTDLYCIFELNRAPTERDATYKMRAVAQDDVKREYRIEFVDADLKKSGNPTLTERLKENGYDAIRPEASGLSPA